MAAGFPQGKGRGLARPGASSNSSLSLSQLEWFDRAEPTELRLRSVKVGSRQCGWINNSPMPSKDSEVKAVGFRCW
jgi:hypothetical protein